MGAWIEISVNEGKYVGNVPSLPSWERGLKFFKAKRKDNGEWVAPFVGAWIEIFASRTTLSCASSLPSWERGLKLLKMIILKYREIVAPFVGAWIEICGF